MLLFLLIVARDISFDKESVQHNFNKERTDCARVRATYSLIGDVSSICVCDVRTQCGFMPLASSWRPRNGDVDIPSA